MEIKELEQQVIEKNMEQTKELKNNMSEMTGVELEQEVKEMPKLCINDIEWNHLEKKYEFSTSTGEGIDDVNENSIENIFNILQEWDKNDEEHFFGKEYDKRVIDNTFQIYVDVNYFKGYNCILSINYELTFLKVDNDIKLVALSGGDMILSELVSQDWKRDVYSYQNHTDKLLSEVMEKNEILWGKYDNDEITWVELIHSLN